MNELTLSEMLPMLALFVLIISGIVAVPVWINTKSTKNRDDFFSLLSKQKAQAAVTEGRVGILEVKQEAGTKRLSEIAEEVGTIHESITEMRLKNQENHLTILGAIQSFRSRSDRKVDNE